MLEQQEEAPVASQLLTGFVVCLLLRLSVRLSEKGGISMKNDKTSFLLLADALAMAACTTTDDTESPDALAGACADTTADADCASIIDGRTFGLWRGS